MNGNASMKRKNRTNTGGRISKSKSMERTYSYDGVYSNARFVHAAASLVGNNIQVQTVEGSVYEGIFRTFSPQFECVIEMAHKVDKSLQKINSFSAPNKDAIIGKLIFRSTDVVMLTIVNADLDYASKDSFATDSAISKYNGLTMERELEPWDEASASEGLEMPSLEMESTNGWDVNDMFRTNEQQYGVQSTYDNALAGYTVQLEKKNTDEYKKQEAKALRIAIEIEGSASYKARIALENADEDEKLSAVVRPTDNCVGKYLAPAKRKNQPQQLGKLQRGAMFPSKAIQGMSHHTGPPPHVLHASSAGVIGLASRYSHGGPPAHNHRHVSPPTVCTGSSASRAKTLSVEALPPRVDVRVNGGDLSSSNSKADGRHAFTKVEAELKTKSLGDGVLMDHHSVPEDAEVTLTSSPPSSPQAAPNAPPKIVRKIAAGPKVPREEETADLKKFKSNFKLSDESCNEELAKPPEVTESKEALLKSDLDDVTSTLKKSTLNPNAKEFVFNPNAKSFTPRSPSTPQTPTPPRQHTPGAAAVMAPPPTLPLIQPHIYTTMPAQYMMSTPISAVSLSPMSSASAVAAMQQQQGPRFRKSAAAASVSVQHRPEFSPSMHVAAATGQPILASPALAAPPSFIQYAPAPGAPQHGVPYTQMYSVVAAPRIVPPQGVTMVSASHLVQHTDPQHVPSQMFVSPHQALPPGPTPPMAPQQQSVQQCSMAQGQTTGMHPNASPVLAGGGGGGMPSTTATQMTYSAQPHNAPSSPHPAASNMASHHHHFHPASTGAPASSYHAGGPQQQPVVLIHQQAAAPPGVSGGAPPHTVAAALQGHALHGAASHLVGAHTSMAMPVIPAATSSAGVAGQHQIYIQHHPSAPCSVQWVVQAVDSQQSKGLLTCYTSRPARSNPSACPVGRSVQVPPTVSTQQFRKRS